MLSEPIQRAWTAVSEPKQSMTDLPSVTLETVLGDYCKLLLASGALAGLVAFIVAFVRSLYLDVVRHVHIEYFRLANYYAGIATGIFFFYLFAGTFIFFLVTLLVWAVSRPSSYTRIVQVTATSMSPVLLFGWIAGSFAVSLLLWTLILLVIGVRVVRAKQPVEAKTSLPKPKRARNTRR